VTKTLSSILVELEHELAAQDTFENRVNLIASYIRDNIEMERCSIFVFKSETNQLQSIYSDGISSLTLHSNTGLVGYAFHKKVTVLVNDTSKSKYFFKGVDQKSGYNTQNVLSVPILNAQHKRLGVIQLLNKPDGFTSWDKNFVESIREFIFPLIDIPDISENSSDALHNSDNMSLEDKIDSYLYDKKLYLMEDQFAYYKILQMQREYFIGADKCYVLDEQPKAIPIYYFTMDEKFASVDMGVKIDSNANGIFINKTNIGENFSFLDLEKDD
jgi:hypothetical protein